MRFTLQILSSAFALSFSVSSFAFEFKSPADLVDVNLIAFRKNVLATASASDISIHNQRTLQSLPKQINRLNRATTISFEFANHLHTSSFLHPIVGEDAVQYQNSQAQIGYCFGRATYAHLALLKLGLDKRSILKIWAVGPIHTGAEQWDFHVATIAMGTDGNWWAIDKFATKPLPVAEWMKLFQSHSQDGKLLFFATEPQKFTAELGAYSRLQMGLDLDSRSDWYQSYFKDLMSWFSKDEDVLKYFRNFGLHRLN